MANEGDSTTNSIPSNGVVSNQQVTSTDSNPSQPVNPENVNQEQPQQQSRGSFLKNLAMNMLIMYVITRMWRPSTDPSAGSNKGDGPSRPQAINIYSNGTVFDMHVYYSENKYFSDFNHTNALLWKKEGLIYGDWYGGDSEDGSFINKNEIILTENMKNNGTIFLHVFITLSGKSPDPSSRSKYLATHTMHKYKQLNRYKKLKIDNKYNLLTGEVPTMEAIQQSGVPVIKSYWHPNITINLINDYSSYVQGTLPPPLDEAVMFTPDGERYKPIVHLNDYWNMMKDYQPINDSLSKLNISMMYQPMSLLKWQFYAALNMRNKFAPAYLADMNSNEDEEDAVKEILMEISPVLLTVSVAVSILHSIFEFLAFKNDIQFWKNKQSLEGLSVRSIFFNVFQSLIVFLYVLDNEANKMVYISVFIGLLIEIWKINKVIDIKVDRENKLFGLFPRISITDKGSYLQSNTKEYDTLGFKYLSWLLYPLVVVYAVYSIMYLEHKGWYSWLLSMMYGFLLTFGFIMMTPQLFINYKMKSVAHLPWRMMTYKALNTFIDDIFAFVIKMPTLYRLSCFRDDIIFFIFLYQRYIYRVDPSRVNEFGFSQDMENETSQVPQKDTDKSIEAKKDD